MKRGKKLFSIILSLTLKATGSTPAGCTNRKLLKNVEISMIFSSFYFCEISIKR